MFDMVPFRRNDVSKRDDFFAPGLKNFFDDSFASLMNHFQGNFRVDLKETPEAYFVEADLPGVKKDAINVEFYNNNLIISAKRDEAVEDKGENYVRRERHFGEFKRNLYIENVDENKIKASFENGVLNITLPKLNKDTDKRKRIDIQ